MPGVYKMLMVRMAWPDEPANVRNMVYVDEYDSMIRKSIVVEPVMGRNN